MLNDLQECYRVLELKPGATPDEVKRSYRELVKVWHPDRFANDPKLQNKAQEKLKQINSAYERICKGESAGPRKRAASAETDSDGDSQKERTQQPPPPRPEQAWSESKHTPPQQRKVASWKHAAIGFGFLVLSLWLLPTIWNDFAKYESTGGIRTARNMFFLYQLLGKEGLVTFFLLFGAGMGYLGLCHARALLSGKKEIEVNLKKGHLIMAGVILGLSVLFGDRPQNRRAETQSQYTQPNTSVQPPQQPAVQPMPKTRQHLTIEQIDTVYREALRLNPDLGMTLQEFSRQMQTVQSDYDFFVGIAYTAPPETPKQRLQKEFTAVPSQPVASIEVVPAAPELAAIKPAVENNPGPAKDKDVEMAYAKASIPTDAPDSTDARNYFTVGSTKDQVIAVQGTPDEFTDSTFTYRFSKVFFKSGRVKSWEQSSLSPLRVKLLPAKNTESKGYFTVGSTKDEVLAAQGTPDEFTDLTFTYRFSKVFFKAGRVKSWEQSSLSPLQVKLLPAQNTESKGYFTVGSTKDEVLAAQGTPDEFTDSTFTYRFSKVFFQSGRVKSWEQSSLSPLQVKLLPSQNIESKGYFTVGSTKDEVLAAQGTPDEFTDSTFTYRFSKVFFQSGRVKSWEQSSLSPLKVKPVSQPDSWKSPP